MHTGLTASTDALYICTPVYCAASRIVKTSMTVDESLNQLLTTEPFMDADWAASPNPHPEVGHPIYPRWTEQQIRWQSWCLHDAISNKIAVFCAHPTSLPHSWLSLAHHTTVSLWSMSRNIHQPVCRGRGETHTPKWASLHRCEGEKKKKVSLWNLFCTYQFSFPADVSGNARTPNHLRLWCTCWGACGEKCFIA